MKTGLFFGSFNPVHHGHLIIAQHMLNFSDLDEIWFVVSPHNPHKNKKDLEQEHHRLEMVKLGIDGNTKMAACDVEFNMEKPSYTIHTLDHLAEKYPEKEFVIILGSDNIEKFSSWKDYQRILDSYSIYVYLREDFVGNDLTGHPGIKIFNASLLDISSTYIRDLVQKEKEIYYLVPEPVREYIQVNKLYKADQSSTL